MSNRESNIYFEKQRDMLIQEIGNSMDSVIYNLDILNRSLNNSIQVGKEFDDVGRLWSHFYDGVNQFKARTMEQQDEPEKLNSDLRSDRNRSDDDQESTEERDERKNEDLSSGTE